MIPEMKRLLEAGAVRGRAGPAARFGMCELCLEFRC